MWQRKWRHSYFNMYSIGNLIIHHFLREVPKNKTEKMQKIYESKTEKGKLIAKLLKNLFAVMNTSVFSQIWA